jgi:hypothetical protein
MFRRCAIVVLSVALVGVALLHAQTPGQAVSANIDVRVIEGVDSSRDQPGRQFRAMVTQPVTAGGVSIPQNTVVNLTLTASGGAFAVTVTSILLNGQPLAVTSGPATVVQSADGGVGQILGRLGIPGGMPNIPGATPLASGPRVALLPGTTLRFAVTATAARTAAPAPAPAALSAGPAAGAGTTGLLSAGSIKETLLGPAKQAGMYMVSPDGGHYAVFSNKGSREIVVIDGVDGPEFDRAGHGQGSLAGLVDFVFSSNGLHSAYVGQRGDSLIAVIDGKEAYTITSTSPSVKGTLLAVDQTTLHDRNEARQVARPFLVSPGGHVAGAVVEVPGNVVAYMFLDGVKSPAYAEIDTKQMAFVGEKLVYAARTQDQKWHVVENTTPGPAFDAIRSLNLSDNDQHYAYIGGGGTTATVVADGVPGTPRAVGTFGIGRDLAVASNGRVAYVANAPAANGLGMAQGLIIDDKLVASDVTPFASYYPDGQYRNLNIALFSPDGKKFAYARRVPGGVAAVLDGKQGISYDSIGVVEFSPDSRRSFFVGGKNVTGNYVVIDGQEHPVQTNIKDFTWSQDGSRFGYVAQHMPEGNVVVVDGQATGGKVFAPIDKTLAFSADGKHSVYASCGFYNDCQLVRDGTPTKIPSLGNFLMRATPSYAFAPVLFSPDGTRLAYTHGGVVGASAAVFVDGKDLGHAAGFSFRAFSPDSRHFAALGRTSQGSMLFIDGKAGPSYDDVLEANLNAMVWTDARTLRVLAVKGGMVYRVTAEAEN